MRKVKAVIDQLEPHWPLTLRQIYYQCVAAQILKNTKAQYEKLSRKLVEARHKDFVPWECMEDRMRLLIKPNLWDDTDDFLPTAINSIFGAYRRDLLQSQAEALEIWIEKDALSRLVAEVADEYGVPVIVARGFASVTFKQECAERIRENIKCNKTTYLLYLGDCDPSGWEMLDTLMVGFDIQFGLGDFVKAERVALLPEQVVSMDLPYDQDAVKKGDSRTGKYRSMLQLQGYDENMAPAPSTKTVRFVINC